MRKRLSKKKKVAFTLIASVLSLFLLECAARLAVPAFMGNHFQLEYFEVEQADLAVDGQDRTTAQEVLHPYFGWTLDPNTNPGTDVDGKHFKVNDFGFYDNNFPITKRKEDQVTIAILGGSFAMEFGMFSGDQLIQLLQADSKFRDKKIRLIRLGMAGFKQPQQLMVLNHVLALGAEYDYVINMDGFNEAVLPATDNAPAMMHIAHPRGWNARLKDVVDPEVRSVSFQIHEIRAKRQLLAIGIGKSWLRSIYLRNLQWRLQDGMLRMRLLQLSKELVNHKLTRKQYAVSGPRNSHEDDQQLYGSMGDLWKNCSWQMHLLCEGNGIQYLHFLQPNQYVPGSKPLSELELEDYFLEDDHEYRIAVQLGYPVLQDRGEELNDMGVKFIDLTPIFKDEAQTIYRDWCCHVNKTGYDLIAKAIAQALTH